MPTVDGSDEQALPFRITVLEGELTQQILQSGQPAGVLSLERTALPYQGVNFGGTQRLKTTNYDGNANATQQVIGPTEDNTHVNGKWSDTKLQIPGGARQLMEVVEQIRRRGVTVEVAWGDRTDIVVSPIVRIGKIAKTTFTFDRPQDCKWEIEFEWQAWGGEQSSAPVVGVATPAQGFSDAVDALNDVDAATSSFLDALGTRIFGLSDPVFDQMNRALAGIETATEAIDLANGAISYTAGVPAYVLQSIGASAQLALSSLADLRASILGLRLTDMVPIDDAISLLKMSDQLFQILGFVDTANGRMVDTHNAADSQAVPDLLATERVAAGTDLRDLARKYYGDPDAWWAIAQYNDFPSSAVPMPPSGPSDDPALPVQIPRLQPGTSSDLRAAC